MMNSYALKEEVRLSFAKEVYEIANRWLNEKHSEGVEDITEEIIQKYFNRAYTAASVKPEWEDNTELLSQEDVLPALVERYKQQESYVRPVGRAIEDDETKHWLDGAKSRIKWHYSGLYERYLRETKKWGWDTVESMGMDTDGILDLMANPREEGEFDRRGLVIANVQSGKTANYIGLIAKAADAGYRFIIVLAGIHNVLRGQTQKRIEEGFTGKDVDTHKCVGVGLFDDFDQSPQAATSRKRDFNKTTEAILGGINLQESATPIVLVIKKNAVILNAVKNWLKRAGSSILKKQPLLLIDDEADNASINVKSFQDDISKINAQIREILQLFSKRVYVGYTATPFANVLIDSRGYDRDAGADIFPKSFIYTLHPSDAYFGADKVFGDIDDSSPRYYREIMNIPLNAEGKPFKSGEVLDTLPGSLEEAVRAFIIACAVRILRGEKHEHMTMMVNVSPYKSVQQSGKLLLSYYLKDLRDAINAYSDLSSVQYDCIQPNPIMRKLEETWQKEYASQYDWQSIRHTLREAIGSIRVAEINSQSKDSLRYEEGPQRVIAIGGYRLSRGLTLEGLMVSYYARNTKAYDSLMQMARWFGYRMGYEDVCRVWMTRESAEWYREVASITEELMDQVDSMLASNMTPMQYGLRIRSNIDVLMITARNKMGSGEQTARVILDGSAVQTTAFNRTTLVLRKNEQLAVEFLKTLQEAGYSPSVPPARENDRGIYIEKVPSQYIIDYLNRYDNSSGSPKTDPELLVKHAGLLEDIGVDRWNVYVASGNSDYTNDTFSVFGKTLIREQRKPAAQTTLDTFYVANRALMSRDVESIPLTGQQMEYARKQAVSRGIKEANIPGWWYRRYLGAPLLVIHPLSMRFRVHPTKMDRERYYPELRERGVWPSIDHVERTVGWSISFPEKGIEEPITYTYNDVSIRQRIGEINVEEEEDAPDE